jgi:hypothetical protein
MLLNSRIGPYVTIIGRNPPKKMLNPKHAMYLFDRFLFLKNTTDIAPKYKIIIRNPTK